MVMSRSSSSRAGQEMDQQLARDLFEQGATLIFMDMPKGTEFGVDCNMWTVDTNFRGIKMIPPGIHFIYYSAVSKEKEVAPRTGFFHDFKQREILVKKWNAQTEDIDVERISADEQGGFEANKQDMDRFLGPYPYDTYKKWVSLTRHITADTIQCLQPLSGRITSVSEMQSESSTTQSRREAAEQKSKCPDTASDPDRDPEDRRLPRMHRSQETTIRFTEIPKKKYPAGTTPGEMTKYSMDHSFVLQTILDSVYTQDEMGVLGEIQFSSLCFLLGQVFDAFEQWKQLVHLPCSCDDALRARPQLSINFIALLHFHIREIPEDFFVDIVTRNNFMVSTLRTFFANLASSECRNELRERGERFRQNLAKRFNWDFTLEDEDDEPVVVDLQG